MKPKNIIITGASKGIGKSLALRFLSQGHHVFAISRSEDLLKQMASNAPKDKFRYLALDLADFNQNHLILKALEDWEKVDVLYNNAGLLIKKPFQKLSADDFTQTWKVNFLAPTILIQSLLSKLNQNSHIVNITTMGAVQGSVKFPELSAYGSSKSAIVTLSEILAQEFGEKGPRINCVALGAVQTEMFQNAFPGFTAPTNPEEMSEFLFDFGLKAHHFMNGKTVQCSLSTP